MEILGASVKPAISASRCCRNPRPEGALRRCGFSSRNQSLEPHAHADASPRHLGSSPSPSTLRCCWPSSASPPEAPRSTRAPARHVRRRAGHRAPGSGQVRRSQGEDRDGGHSARAPVEQPEEEKEVEPDLTNVVTSTEAQHEEQVVTEDPKPVEDAPVEAVPVQEQAPQVATLIEQSSGLAQQGGDTTQRRAYLGTLSKSIERAKVNPRSRQAGTVMVRFTVGPDGEPDLTRRREELRLHGARRGGHCRARPRRALPADAPERRQGADRGERPLRVRHPLIAESIEPASGVFTPERTRASGRA